MKSAMFAARHSQRRQAAAQRNTLLGAAGAILSGILLGNSGIGQQLGQAALQGSQLLTLKFSRSQELEADELGIRYLNSAGYDPRAMATVLQSLALQNALDARVQGRDDARLPEWASTHPDPASRVQTALQKAQASGATGGVTNRDTFLTRIDGITYGDDPAQGVVEGRQFIHPTCALAFTAPQGFYMINGTRAVTINGQSGQAQFTLAQYNGDLGSYVTSVFAGLSQQQQIRPQSVQRTTVNGLPAAYGTARVNNGNSQVDVTVFAYEFCERPRLPLPRDHAGGQGVYLQPDVRFRASHRLTNGREYRSARHRRGHWFAAAIRSIRWLAGWPIATTRSSASRS